jgi:hypothetical protein
LYIYPPLLSSPLPSAFTLLSSNSPASFKTMAKSKKAKKQEAGQVDPEVVEVEELEEAVISSDQQEEPEAEPTMEPEEEPLAVETVSGPEVEDEIQPEVVALAEVEERGVAEEADPIVLPEEPEEEFAIVTPELLSPPPKSSSSVPMSPAPSFSPSVLSPAPGPPGSSPAPPATTPPSEQEDDKPQEGIMEVRFKLRFSELELAVILWLDLWCRSARKHFCRTQVLTHQLSLRRQWVPWHKPAQPR